MNNRIYKIMQLADSSLPVGGFAFSNGLEWMIKNGEIKTYKDFYSFLDSCVDQLWEFDLIYISNFIEEEISALEKLELYDQMLLIPSMRRASVIQGKSWLRIFPNIFSKVDISSISEGLKKNKLPFHFLYIFTRTLLISGFNTDSIIKLFVYLQIRDQISCAVRLGIIGPTMAQKIESDILEYSDSKLIKNTNTNISQAFRVTPMLDIAQCGHSALYSKMFQN